MKTGGLCFLRQKTRKRWKSLLSSQNFPRHPYDPKIKISVLKCSFNYYNFSMYVDFSNSIQKISYSESTKSRAILPPPPLGQRGLMPKKSWGTAFLAPNIIMIMLLCHGERWGCNTFFRLFNNLADIFYSSVLYKITSCTNLIWPFRLFSKIMTSRSFRWMS